MTETIELYRCKDCGETYPDHGSIAAHVDAKHRGYTRLGIQLPFTKTSPGNAEKIMKHIEQLECEVTDARDLGRKD